MRNYMKFWHFICSLFCVSLVVSGTEFTFDLEKNGQQCFYEVVDRGVVIEFEFQVSFSRMIMNSFFFVGRSVKFPKKRFAYTLRS